MRRVYDAEHGDYVLCCKYSDRNPNDQWQIGFIDYTFTAKGSTNKDDKLFVMQKPMRSYFKVCFLITIEEGKIIVENKKPNIIEENSAPSVAIKGCHVYGSVWSEDE